MNKWAELFFGLIILIGAILIAGASSIYGWTIFGKDLNFLHAAWIVLKGGILWAVAFVGLLFIILGISDLKD